MLSEEHMLALLTSDVGGGVLADNVPVALAKLLVCLTVVCLLWHVQVGGSNRRMDQYCALLERLAKYTKLSSEVRLACRGVLDMRTAKWARHGAALVEKYGAADVFREHDEKKAKAGECTHMFGAFGFFCAEWVFLGAPGVWYGRRFPHSEN
jgi:hypothetical protein